MLLDLMPLSREEADRAYPYGALHKHCPNNWISNPSCLFWNYSSERIECNGCRTFITIDHIQAKRR